MKINSLPVPRVAGVLVSGVRAGDGGRQGDVVPYSLDDLDLIDLPEEVGIGGRAKCFLSYLVTGVYMLGDLRATVCKD